LPENVRLSYDGLQFEGAEFDGLWWRSSVNRRVDCKIWESAASAAAVTSAIFDGVHRGHQDIPTERRALRGKRARWQPCSLFIPPGARPEAQKAPLCSYARRELAGLRFTGSRRSTGTLFDEKPAQTERRDFVNRFLVGRLAGEHGAVRRNFRFGHAQAGDVSCLNGLGQRWIRGRYSPSRLCSYRRERNHHFQHGDSKGGLRGSHGRCGGYDGKAFFARGRNSEGTGMDASLWYRT